MEEKATQEVEESAEVDYIAAIKNLQESTVPKEIYEKAKRENKMLLDALVTGKKLEGDASPKNVDVAALRKALYSGGEMTNIEYIKKTLDLRKAIIEGGGRDPFLPVGTVVSDTAEMHETAQKVADGLQSCLDFADGDSGVFSAQLQRITKDPPIQRRR